MTKSRRPSNAVYKKNAEIRKHMDMMEGKTCAACGGEFFWDYETGRVRVVDWYKQPYSWTADHIEPYAKAPEKFNSLENLQGMHRTCNQSKSDKVDHQRNIPTQRKNSRRW